MSGSCVRFSWWSFFFTFTLFLMPSPVKISPFVNTLETCGHKGSPGMFLNVFYGFIFPPATNIGNVRLASGLLILLDLFLFSQLCVHLVFSGNILYADCATLFSCGILMSVLSWGGNGGVVMNNSNRCSAVPVGRFQIIFYFKQTIQCYVSYNILSPAALFIYYFECKALVL